MTGERRKCKACKIMFIQKPCTKGIFCEPRCKKWSQIKWKKVECAACGKELKRAASELKRTGSSVCNRKCQTKAKWIDPKKVVELREQGLSFRKIGKELGFGRNKAEYTYKRFTTPPLSPTGNN